MSSINAKGLCPIGAKEAREKSAESKGLTIKKKDNGFDNTRRRTPNLRGIQRVSKWDKNTHISIQVQKQTFKKKAKIKPISKDKAIENAELAKIKKQKIESQGNVCEMCRNNGNVDLFHIIGVGDKKHSTNPINLLLSCRFCHLVWGANDWGKIVKFKNFDEIMERLKSLDEGKYWKLWHKLERFLKD